MFPDDDFVVFENQTTGIGSKLLKRMGYEGKCLGINGQGIINPIIVEELPRQGRLGYVRKEVGECAMTITKPPTTNDEKPSSVLCKSKEEVKYFDFLLVSSSHSIMCVGYLEILITGTNMRLLTRMRHKEKEELGANNQGITPPLEVVHEHPFAS